MSSMEIIWALLVFFAFVTIVFIAIAFYFPEWVGITGKKAHEIQQHQQSDSPEATKDSEKEDSEK